MRCGGGLLAAAQAGLKCHRRGGGPVGIVCMHWNAGLTSVAPETAGPLPPTRASLAGKRTTQPNASGMAGLSCTPPGMQDKPGARNNKLLANAEFPALGAKKKNPCPRTSKRMPTHRMRPNWEEGARHRSAPGSERWDFWGLLWGHAALLPHTPIAATVNHPQLRTTHLLDVGNTPACPSCCCPERT